jgi:anti-sigma regulatory factor (Ser/Thr protein kinase)
MSATLELCLVNAPGEIARLAGMIETFLADQGLPANLVFQVNLAIDEVLSNTMSYGFAPGTRHEMAVSLTVGQGEVGVVLADDGVAFDPLAQAGPPVLSGGIDERPPGGLGIYLVRTMMDEVRYERADGRNRLSLVKRTGPVA